MTDVRQAKSSWLCPTPQSSLKTGAGPRLINREVKPDTGCMNADAMVTQRIIKRQHSINFLHLHGGKYIPGQRAALKLPATGAKTLSVQTCCCSLHPSSEQPRRTDTNNLKTGLKVQVNN